MSLPPLESAGETDGNKQQQLVSPSPTLSPISEHGYALEPFMSLPLDQTHFIDKSHGESQAPRERRRSSGARALKLSPRQIHDLTTAAESLPLRPMEENLSSLNEQEAVEEWQDGDTRRPRVLTAPLLPPKFPFSPLDVASTPGGQQKAAMPPMRSKTPPLPGKRRTSSNKSAKGKPLLPPLKTDDSNANATASRKLSSHHDRLPSPMPTVLPIPPLSLPTYLHLELSSDRPSPLYIHRSGTSDMPYESSAIKFERLYDFLMLPPQLERVLIFGAVACLDAWLYTFTILPLRFLKALVILLRWMAHSAVREIVDLFNFVYVGIGRLWRRLLRPRQATQPKCTEPALRSRRTSASEDDRPQRTSSIRSTDLGNGEHVASITSPKRHRKPSAAHKHRRSRSTPSTLDQTHKADLLHGLLIITSCLVLMRFDASRMYHSIRGQAAIKLYVIYNVLEVFDRLLSALGQDILECLFSRETLERKADGRSKIIRPFWMFLLALAYVIGHSTALFYQVVTLNVAVNSYSNALLTLLLSNQFVEIKSTVFKKFEKENLFQITCADVVERFTLWLMLLIIALRNIVEVGGLSISLGSALSDGGAPLNQLGANATGIPLVSGFVIPKAFTLMPKWTGEVLGPFLIVLGSEALVDWCKHAYITKFNNMKPHIYGRFLDVMAKDYYSHAFADQNLTKRLGLPVIPLSCLFIRAVVQAYHMFLATHIPAPITSTATSISVDSDTVAGSSATMAALSQFDQVLRRALGRSAFGAGGDPGSISSWWGLDDFIALATMVVIFLVAFLVLLALKLVLGMCLLSYARNRYRDMKERENSSVDTHGRRVGGWGTVEVSEDKRRWIYADDPEGLANVRERDSRSRQKADKGEMKLDHVNRYTMVAKRIW